MNVGAASASVAHANPGASTAGLEAQIARDKKELSSCINCESAKTRKGQENIQALSAKINATEARLEALRARESDGSRTNGAGEGLQLNDQTVNGVPRVAVDSPDRSSSRPISTTGGLIDLYA